MSCTIEVPESLQIFRWRLSRNITGNIGEPLNRVESPFNHKVNQHMETR